MHIDKNAESPYDVVSDGSLLAELAHKVFKWGVARNITADGGATALSQIKKLKEEVQELEDALIAGDEEGVTDGIGDSLVVLLQICRLGGYDLVECLMEAYDEIKDRKGTMVNGVFVKES